ncbi:TniQ protein [Sphingobium fuliginis]|uniref:TniQ protein n=1 Tax=Sphingobium fuliginis (strain ATCC 27551) TaxID=336203 RepID=A0A292ZEK3_SPHSA|nr:TniQ protein [Sphingobium fuliginis]
MRRLLPALSCALIAMAAPAQARTAEDEQFWLNLTAMGPISGDLVYFAEIQPRFGDGVSGVDQTILRGGLGSVAKIVKLEHAWRRLDGRNDDGFQVAPFPG